MQSVCITKTVKCGFPVIDSCSEHTSHSHDTVQQEKVTNCSNLLKRQEEDRPNNAKDQYCVSFLKDGQSGMAKRVKFRFSSGDTFQCIHPKYEGFAFTLSERVGDFAICQHVWMKAEKTYLGAMLLDQGHKWVLVKEHPKIPSYAGKLGFKYLWNGIKLPKMNQLNGTALCYEETNASSFAYDRQLGKHVQTKMNTSKKAPVVLDLFAGGGGMSCGLRDSGFNVKYEVCPMGRFKTIDTICYSFSFYTYKQHQLVVVIVITIRWIATRLHVIL